MLRKGTELMRLIFLRSTKSFSKKNTNFNNVRIHIIDSSLVSFVKSWAADDYGEVLDYSDAYQKVLTTEKGFATCEEAPKRVCGLRGCFQ